MYEIENIRNFLITICTTFLCVDWAKSLFINCLPILRTLDRRIGKQLLTKKCRTY